MPDRVSVDVITFPTTSSRSHCCYKSVPHLAQPPSPSTFQLELYLIRDDKLTYLIIELIVSIDSISFESIQKKVVGIDGNHCRC